MSPLICWVLVLVVSVASLENCLQPHCSNLEKYRAERSTKVRSEDRKTQERNFLNTTEVTPPTNGTAGKKTHISDFTNPRTGLNPFLDLKEGISATTSRTVSFGINSETLTQTVSTHYTEEPGKINKSKTSTSFIEENNPKKYDSSKMEKVRFPTIPKTNRSYTSFPLEPTFNYNHTRPINHDISFGGQSNKKFPVKGFPLVSETMEKHSLRSGLQPLEGYPNRHREAWPPYPLEGQSNGRKPFSREPFEASGGRRDHFSSRPGTQWRPPFQPQTYIPSTLSEEYSNTEEEGTGDYHISEFPSTSSSIETWRHVDEEREEKDLEETTSSFDHNTITLMLTTVSHSEKEQQLEYDEGEFQTAGKEVSTSVNKSVIVWAVVSATVIVAIAVLFGVCMWRRRTKRIRNRREMFLEEETSDVKLQYTSPSKIIRNHR
ncbi:uncharacterized protein LOC106468101 [Limulus polyphemus]|uniref:Uncharacterized protein LOC106468101 n=1 Tax=Limulus polyphemus TaxID=6850 RepID=A0ABM1BKT0_LIMPO|nr:uncharacterized protein LOC106468101 [Limulus polyphemus]XP_013783969.1 uncharacterized protein LOC106468101 [Limulus polyphemus]XP_022252112.1 uncharacterized protein LOC106468101 [Limulus polyphemus]